MKAKIIIALLLSVSAAAFAAPPKVAVLDAVLPEGMDPNIAIGVTEKISEELVASGKYTVLDRTTVGQSLKEIEFQMSGLVSDADIKKAGEQLNSRLGASFVVVARVSQVAGTFFISAKLIDIQTGEINAQASYEAEGTPAVTFQIAQVVGKKLAVGAREVTQLPADPGTTPPSGGRVADNTSKPVTGTTTGTAAPKAKLRSHIVGAYQLTAMAGSLYDTYAVGNLSSMGFNAHWLQSLGGLYLMGVVDATDTSEFGTTAGVDIGVGFGFPIFGIFQVYGGIFTGYTVFLYAQDTTIWNSSYAGSSDGGINFGGEVGVDLILANFLTVSLRTSYTGFGLSDGDTVGYFGTSLGVGIAY